MSSLGLCVPIYLSSNEVEHSCLHVKTFVHVSVLNFVSYVITEAYKYQYMAPCSFHDFIKIKYNELISVICRVSALKLNYLYEGVSRSFRTESRTKCTLTVGITR